jgi:hypothetical protein
MYVRGTKEIVRIVINIGRKAAAVMQSNVQEKGIFTYIYIHACVCMNIRKIQARRLCMCTYILYSYMHAYTHT